MADPTLRELAQAVADAAHDYAVTAMKEDGPLADAERELADAERALGDGLDWLPQDKVSDVLAGIILAALDAERAAGTRSADDKVLDALRREKAALDSLEALKAAHAAEVEKLKAEINALNEALREECE